MSEQIISKRCSKCKQVKSTSEFTKKPSAKCGLHSQCKQCLNAAARYIYHNCGGAEKKRQYQQTETYKKNQRKSYKRWYDSKGKKWSAKYGREYRKTAKGKQVHEKAIQKWRNDKGKIYFRNLYKQNPNQFKAYDAIKNAIKNGDILSPKLLKCTYCDHKAILYHHKSYEPECWLIVIPVCGLCHKKVHRELSLIG